jgi:hypothetical protein
MSPGRRRIEINCNGAGAANRPRSNLPDRITHSHISTTTLERTACHADLEGVLPRRNIFSQGCHIEGVTAATLPLRLLRRLAMAKRQPFSRRTCVTGQSNILIRRQAASMDNKCVGVAMFGAKAKRGGDVTTTVNWAAITFPPRPGTASGSRVAPGVGSGSVRVLSRSPPGCRLNGPQEAQGSNC